MNQNKRPMSKLTRKDGVILGVCAGLADYFDTDVVIVRIAYVVITFFTGWLPFTVLYFILGIALKKEETGTMAQVGAVCSSCSSPINSNAKFCTSCGNKI